MRKFLGWLLSLPLIVIAVSFTISNRQSVGLELWPLPFHLDLPLYLPVLLAVVLGILLGGTATWLGGSGGRRLSRERQRRISTLERELEAARKPDRA